MGYGFKIGGRGIVLRPTEIKIYDGATEISNLTIEGSSPTKTLKFTYIADNGKLGDGTVSLTSDSSLLTVSQTDSQKKANEFTLTFNGMDVDTQSVNLTLSADETKHFLATSMVLPITLKRSEPTIKLATTELKIVGGSPSGSINITSYDGDGELTATSSDTEYATVKVVNSSGVAVTYIKGDKNLTVKVGCKAGKFYKASEGATCAVTCTRSDPTITLNGYVATVYGGGSSSVVNITYSGLEGSTTNLMPIKVASDDESIATVILSNNSAIISYAGAGTTNVRIYTEMGNYYNAASAVVAVTCAKTSVTVPTLSSTTVYTTGSAVGPSIDYHSQSDLITVSGTTSTASLGSYTIYWNLKDTSKYCWADGTTGQKSASWTCAGGTITFYVEMCVGSSGSTYDRWSVFKATFNVPYGKTWVELCQANYYASSFYTVAQGSQKWVSATNFYLKYLTYSYNYIGKILITCVADYGNTAAIGTYWSQSSSAYPEYGDMWYQVKSVSVYDGVADSAYPVNGKTYFASSFF